MLFSTKPGVALTWGIYEILKLEYPVLWTGMKSFPAEGRGKCAMQST